MHEFILAHTHTHTHICICIYMYIYNTYKSKLHQINVPESHFQIHLQVPKSKRGDGLVSRAESIFHTAKLENARGRIVNKCVFRRTIRSKGFGSNRFHKIQNGLEIYQKDSAAYDVCQVRWLPIVPGVRVCVCACVYTQRERTCACVCACVCVREREKERQEY